MADIQIPQDVYDIIIVGGGPGGLTAGLYTSRADMKTLLLEGNAQASQITMTDMIENYPGIPAIGGLELNNTFKNQAVAFGLEARPEQVVRIDQAQSRDVKGWEVVTDGGAYRTLSVIISTGAAWSRLGVPREEEMVGRGISYCATCDAPFYRNREVGVVGGGDTAVQEAVYLTKFASKVTLVHRRDRLRATAVLQKRVFANEKITVTWNSVVEEILGEENVTGVRIRNVKEADRREEIAADGVFIFVGLVPNTDIIREVVNLDEDGYIITDRDMKTSSPGIFACGDCIRKSLRQVVTACGDGATAAHSASLYVDDLKGQAY